MGLLLTAAFVLSYPSAFAYATEAGRVGLVVLALAVIAAQTGRADRLSVAKYIAAPVASACAVLEARAASEAMLSLAVALLSSIAAIAST